MIPLEEFRDYYSRLFKMEAEAEADLRRSTIRRTKHCDDLSHFRSMTTFVRAWRLGSRRRA